MRTTKLFSFLTVLVIFGMMAGCAPQSLPVETVTAEGQIEASPLPTATPQASITPTSTPAQAATETKSPTQQPTSTADWASNVANVVNESGGEWYVLVREVDGETLYAAGENEVIHPASVIKVAIAALFFVALEKAGPLDDLESNLRNRGVDERTYDQLLRAMLVKSEESAADSLQVWIQDRLRPEDVLKAWGLDHTKLTPRRSTLNDIELLFEGLYTGKWISPQAREYLFQRLAEYSPNDELRLGAIRSCQAEGEAFYNKRGTLTDERLIVGDAALVERGEQLFFVGVFTYQSPEWQPQTTYERLEAGLADFTAVFCSFLGTTP